MATDTMGVGGDRLEDFFNSTTTEVIARSCYMVSHKDGQWLFIQ